MSGESFDISKPRTAKDSDVDFMLGELYDYAKRMQGITEDAGDDVYIYFGGVGSTSYFKFNKVTKELSLYLDDTLMASWNSA